MGRFEAGSGEGIEITSHEPAEHRYRKLVVSDGKAVGAILIGYPRDVATISAAVKQRADVSAYLDDLRAGNWEVLGKVLDQQKTARAA